MTALTRMQKRAWKPPVRTGCVRMGPVGGVRGSIWEVAQRPPWRRNAVPATPPAVLITGWNGKSSVCRM